MLLAVLWFAGIGAVLALVFGYRARSQIKNSAGTQTGSGLATAGIILGWIGITILAAGIILISLHPNNLRFNQSYAWGPIAGVCMLSAM